MNLVNNGLQAAGKGAELIVEARQIGDKLGIEVRDSGPGMDAELCAKVMEPSFQPNRMVRDWDWLSHKWLLRPIMVNSCCIQNRVQEPRRVF